MPGAKEDTLNVLATGADGGRRYRAIFSNSVGQIATKVASLSVGISRAGGGGGSARDPGPPALLPMRASRRPALRPGLRLASGAGLVVRFNGVATLGRISCRPPRPCTVRAPKRIKMRIGGGNFAVKVLVERTLSADSSTPLRLQFPRRAKAAIRHRRAVATVPLVVTSAAQRLERIVSVTLRGRDVAQR